MTTQPIVTIPTAAGGTFDLATPTIQYAMPTGSDLFVGPTAIWTDDGWRSTPIDLVSLVGLILTADPVIVVSPLPLTDGRILAWFGGYRIATEIRPLNPAQCFVMAGPPDGGDQFVDLPEAMIAPIVFELFAGGGGGGPPLSNAVPMTVEATPGSAGVSGDASRADHVHEALTGVPVSIGVSNAPGVSSLLARADHVHDGSGILGAVLPTTIRSGDAANAGIATTAARADHTHAVLLPVTPANVDAGPPHAGLNTTPARDDHRHSAVVGLPVSVGLANSSGVLDALSRADHVHDGSAVIAAAMSNAVPSTIEVGDAGAPGVGPQASRSDHQHALAAGVLAPVAVDAGPAVIGVSTVVSREDHKHGIDTAAPVAIGTANAVGVSLSLSRADHVHSGLPLLTVAAPSSIDVGDAATVGVATTAARADHQHAFPAGPAPVNVNAAAAVAGVATTPARSDHKHSIDTAAPVSIGVANAAGVSTSLARADHVHDGSGILAGAGAPLSVILAAVGSVGVATTAARSDHSHPYPLPDVIALTNNLGTALGAVETVVFNDVMSITGTRFVVYAETLFAFSPIAAGTNGATLRIYVNGVLIDEKTYTIVAAGVIGATITHTAVPIAVGCMATGIGPGNHTVEIRAIKVAGVGTANLAGFQKCVAFPV